MKNNVIKYNYIVVFHDYVNEPNISIVLTDLGEMRTTVITLIFISSVIAGFELNTSVR